MMQMVKMLKVGNLITLINSADCKGITTKEMATYLVLITCASKKAVEIICLLLPRSKPNYRNKFKTYHLMPLKICLVDKSFGS